MLEDWNKAKAWMYCSHICVIDGYFACWNLSQPHAYVCHLSPFLRCKEGYQGVRCDQFLPKTDSILSDPSRSSIFLLSLTQYVSSAYSEQRLLAQLKPVFRSFVSECCQGRKLVTGVNVQSSRSELTWSKSRSALLPRWDLVSRFSSAADLHWKLQQTLLP